MKDETIRPDHYQGCSQLTRTKLADYFDKDELDGECIEALRGFLSEDQFVGFCLGNYVKYLWRLGRKGDIEEDTKKALFYRHEIIKSTSKDEIAQLVRATLTAEQNSCMV